MDESNAKPEPSETNAEAPTKPKALPLTTVGKGLLVLFLLGIAVFFVSKCSWMEKLDAPEEGVMLVPAGTILDLKLGLSSQSIQGSYAMDLVYGMLDAGDGNPPRPVPVRDKGGKSRGDSGEARKQWLATAAAHGLAQINTVIEAKIPADSELINRTVTVTFTLALTAPQILERDGKKSIVETPVREVDKVSMKIMPPGYLRIHERLGRGAFWTCVLVFIAGLTRVFFRSKEEDSEES